MKVIPTLAIVLISAAFSPGELSLLIGQTKENLSVASPKDLRNASTEVVIDNRALSLSAFPWRDFMPGGWGQDGSPLMVSLKVSSVDRKSLPNVRLDRAWVLFGEQTWEIFDLRGRTAGQNADKDSWIDCSNVPVCETTVRDGPKWGPGVFVDIVVRLTDSKGNHHLLRAPNQNVMRSD